MSDCCCGPKAGTDPNPGLCSRCRTQGQPVEELTIKALLSELALRRFEPAAYRFCPDPSCDVVYFSETGPAFWTQDVRVSVWHKQPPGQRTVCYCFDENEAAIAAEIRETGVSHAPERVRAHIAAHRCACEVRNPRGVCCLGDVIAAVDRVHAQ
jgi:hypothetical protein